MSLPRRLSPTWLAFGLTVLVRALVALSRMDELQLDLYSGSLAWAWLQRMPLDHGELPIIAHLRGSVASAVLVLPFFALLGPSMMALKLVAVLWSGATAALFAALLERCAGARAALVGALLFAFLPPSYQIVDVLALGSHGDSVVFYLAAALALLGRGTPLGARRTAAFGAVAGAGLCFSLHFVVCLPALLLVWWLCDRRFPLRGATWLGALASLPFLALIPYLTRDTSVQGKSADSHFLNNGWPGALEKTVDFFAGDFRRSLLFDANGGAWASWLWLAAVLVGVALCARRIAAREPLPVFLAAYSALYLVAFALTDFELAFTNTLNGMGSRYTMPFLPLLAGFAALACARLADAGRLGASRALLAIALVPGVVGTAALLDPHFALRQPPLRGTQFSRFHPEHFARASGGDLGARLEQVERVDPDWPALRPLFYEGFALERRAQLNGTWRFADEVARTREHGEPLRPYLLVQLGRDAALVGYPGRREGETLLEWLAELEAVRAARGPEALAERASDAELAWVVRGAMRVVPGTMSRNRLLGREDHWAFDFVERLPARLRAHGAEGLGLFAGALVTPYHRIFLDLIDDARALPDDVRPCFYTALGLAYRTRFREELYTPPEPAAVRIEARLPEEGRAAFRAALSLPHERVGCRP